MRVIILTSSRYGTAGHHLPDLLKHKDIDVSAVIYSRGVIKDKWKFYKNKIGKVFKIGLLGTLNGIRMRRWYTKDLENYLKIEDIQAICEREHITYHEVDNINSDETRGYFREAKADLGISLGNGYISKKIFSIPKNGMINIHHEILPEFQNAQSVIWQIYKGSSVTGYTIHEINSRIDEGIILYKEFVPIEIKKTLGETVSATYAKLLQSSLIGLVNVLCKYNSNELEKIPQSSGKKYTTPNILEFICMNRRHSMMQVNKRCE